MEVTGCRCEFNLSHPGPSSPALEVNKQNQGATLRGGHQMRGGVVLKTFMVPSSPDSLTLGLLGQMRPSAAGGLETFRSPMPSSFLTHLQYCQVG